MKPRMTASISFGITQLLIKLVYGIAAARCYAGSQGLLILPRQLPRVYRGSAEIRGGESGLLRSALPFWPVDLLSPQEYLPVNEV